MANFMEQMYAQNDPKEKENKERQQREIYAINYANDVCSAVRDYISSNWDKHRLEGYIHLYVFDGNNISFTKEPDNKPRQLPSLSGPAYTYSQCLKMKTNQEADLFTKQVRDTMARDGVKNFSIRKDKIEVESCDLNSFLKLRKKEYDAYIFYIDLTW